MDKDRFISLEVDSKNKLLNYLKKLESQHSWRPAYGISASAEHTTVLSSCFALFIYELTGELQQFSTSERSEWAEYLKSFQDEKSGLFLDPLAHEEDFANRKHDWQYFTWQTTFFCLSALDALGHTALFPLRFIQPYRGTTALTTWLNGLNWGDPWLESNKIMFLASSLIQSGGLEDVHSIFDWLDRHQDPQTGYWGTEQRADLLNAMAGAFHFYFLYLYLQRPFQYMEQIIDSTLSLQQPDGLYDPRGGGGACLDLDAVDILVKLSLLTDYRSEDINASLQRTCQAVLSNQRGDGSFCEAVRAEPQKSLKRRLAEIFLLDKVLKKPYRIPRFIERYAGWEKMAYGTGEGDLWSGWFRLLALALISTRYSDNKTSDTKWNFKSSAVLGWHDESRISSEQSVAKRI